MRALVVSRGYFLLVVSLTALLLLAGCVSRGTYNVAHGLRSRGTL